MFLSNGQLSQNKQTKATRLLNAADYWKYTTYVISKYGHERLQKRLSAKIVNGTHATFHSRADVPQRLLNQSLYQ